MKLRSLWRDATRPFRHAWRYAADPANRRMAFNWRDASRPLRHAWRVAADPANRRVTLLWCATLPAITVLASGVWLIVIAAGAQRQAQTWYAQKAAAAMASGDAVTARLCYSGLLQRQPDNAAYQYGMAMCLLKLGDTQSAAAIIRGLAPEDHLGYGPAHQLAAEELLTTANATEAQIARAETHLKYVIEADPQSVKAHALLAAIYAKQEKWQLATPHLAIAGPAVDELGLLAARAYAVQGDRTASLEWARRASAFFAEKVAKDPANDDARLNWAQAELMTRDFAKTVEILEAARDYSPNPAYPRAIARVIALWIHDANLDAPRRLALLENGLRWNPEDGELIQLIFSEQTMNAVRAVAPTTQPVAGAALRATCDAIKAAVLNDPCQAREELELSIRLGGEPFVAIAANIASAWSSAKDANLEQPRVFSDALLAIRPDDPIAQRAQGLVLARQKQWRDSLLILEKLLPAMAEDRAVHAAMADCYEGLGQAKLAKDHRDLANAPTTQPTTMPQAAAPK